MEQKKILLKEVVLAFPNLFAARENMKFPGSGKTFSAQIRIYDSDPQAAAKIEAIKQAMQQAASDKWGTQGPRVYKAAIDSKNTRMLQRNDEEGFFYFNAKRREDQGGPVVVGRSREVLTSANGPRSGDICNVIFHIWCYDKTSRGFSAELQGVQFVREGEVTIGGTSVAKADDFEQLEAPASQGAWGSANAAEGEDIPW